MNCPACTKPTEYVFEGDQVWCSGCGRLYWLNRDGTVRGVRVPSVIAAHEVCHNLKGDVGARKFADGCIAEQRKHFGCAPDHDRAQLLEREVNRLEAEVAKLSAEKAKGREPGW